MKKGFTLIELLAVIVIIGVLSSITFVVVDNVIKNGKETLYDSQLQNIYSGTNNYVVDYINSIDTTSGFDCVTLLELENGNYIDKDLKNPKTEQVFNKNLKIKIIETNAGYKYELDENNECPSE